MPPGLLKVALAALGALALAIGLVATANGRPTGLLLAACGAALLAWSALRR